MLRWNLAIASAAKTARWKRAITLLQGLHMQHLQPDTQLEHIGAGLWFLKRSLGLLFVVGGVAGEVCNQELWNLYIYIFEFTLCCLVGDPFVLAKEASKMDGWAAVGKSSSFRLLV